jgi:hypothetical protein
MVDALRRAHQMVKPDGCVVDLHPSAELAPVEVGGMTSGHVDVADAPLRHAAAGVALATVIAEGLFAIERRTSFLFYTYGDTIEELREHVEENWRNARIDDRTVDRTREVLRDVPGARPRTCEHVYVTRLRPWRR